MSHQKAGIFKKGNFKRFLYSPASFFCVSLFKKDKKNIILRAENFFQNEKKNYPSRAGDFKII